MTLSIIIPVLNEVRLIEACLGRLSDVRARGTEIIVVDGGSQDGTAAIAESFADRVLPAPRGRASQMNAGANVAKGDILVFLHADTTLPQDTDVLIEKAFAHSDRIWGRFDTRIVPATPSLFVVAWLMNLRSRLSGIATGDQAIFVRKSAFMRVGGYPEIPLMEDIALSKKLKRISKPICLRAKVSTSARRWQKYGVTRTILLMWWLRLAYYLGADPKALARQYDYVPRPR